MAIGDIYQVSIKQRVNGNDAINVWYCESVNDEKDAEDIALAVIDTGIPQLAGNQNSNLEYYEVIATNLFNDTDQWTESISIAGAGSGAAEVLPLHDAVGVVLNHDNPSIRKGAKRMAGNTETASTQYGVLSAASVSAWDTAVNGFIDGGVSEEVSEGLFQTIAEWVIVKSLPVVVEGVTGYRLPESAVEAVVGYITSAVIKPNITTQVSRKQGVGS